MKWRDFNVSKMDAAHTSASLNISWISNAFLISYQSIQYKKRTGYLRKNNEQTKTVFQTWRGYDTDIFPHYCPFVCGNLSAPVAFPTHKASDTERWWLIFCYQDNPLETPITEISYVPYTQACETSAGCLRSIYPSLGMRQLFGDVTMGQWRHN